MTPDQWSSIEEQFDALRELPPERQATGLAAIADPYVRSEVASLLEHSGGGETIAAVIGAVAGQAEPAASILQTDRLGPYRLGRRIGHGGQGAVFLAVRDDRAFEKQVAIKILQLGADYPEARARFAQERQILAGLEHPYIARLLDGGETETGLSYFVLEFIDGKNILEYAAGKSLSQDDRLRLFLKICDAVQYAHQNLVVHRDLKPGNILVSADGTPKLLDFGIAKMLSGDVTRTMTGLQSMTPQYASPEQVRGHAITTASDIYSLGVILYELLTGRRPYKVSTTSSIEIDRAVCQTAPDPPRVSGDLDNILLMALRKEPQRRYPSVEQFAGDVRRYLAGQPVLAHGESLTYSAGKFLRRNRLAVIAATLVLLSAVIGFLFTYREKQRAERRYAEVRQLASSFLFDFENQLHDLPGATKAREMVVSTALDYLNRLSRDAQGDRGLLAEIAQAYDKTAAVQGWPSAPNLGHHKDALATFGKAVSIWEGLVKSSPTDAYATMQLSICLSKSADVQRQLRLYKDGQQSSRRASEFAAKALALKPSDLEAERVVAVSLRGQGLALMGLGDAAAAVPVLRRAVEAYGKIQRPGALPAAYDYAIINGNLALALERRGELAEALIAVNRSIEIYEGDLATWSGRSGLQRNRMQSYQAKGNLLGARDRPNLGRPAEAMAAYERARDLSEAAFRADPNNALARQDYALGLGKIADLVASSDPHRSLELSDRALAVLRQGASVDDTPHLEAGYYLSVVEPLRALGRPKEAEERLQQAMTILRPMIAETPGAITPQTDLAGADAAIGELRSDAGQWRSAAESYQHSLALQEPLGKAHPEDLRLQWQLAALYDNLALNASRAVAAHAGPSWTDDALRWRQKSVDLWRSWLQRTPGSAYGQQRLHMAESAF